MEQLIQHTTVTNTISDELTTLHIITHMTSMKIESNLFKEPLWTVGPMAGWLGQIHISYQLLPMHMSTLQGSHQATPTCPMRSCS